MADFPSNVLRGEQDSCIPNFHYQQVHNEERSEEEGKTVFEQKEFVEIIIPGNARERPIFEVEDSHRERWPLQYDRFLKKQEQRLDEGLPLMEWSQITRTMAASFEHDKVYTVEQLANLPDANLMSMGPGMLDLKYKAQKYLEMQTGEAAINKIINENLEKDKRIEALELKVDELIEKIDQSTDKKSKPPVAKAGK